jgi:plastocyanin
MTWRWAICFSCAAAAWAATISGKVELAGSKLAAGHEKDDSGVVVWLDPANGAAPQTPPASASIAHRKKTFVPHVVAVRTGSKVTFPNLDPFFHNAFSNYSGQTFDIGLHPPGSTRQVTFTRPGIVRIFCNIHPTMSAVIVVLNSPWFAVTDASGAFRIEAPPGEYRLQVFHERAQPEVLAALEQRVTAGTEAVALGTITISEEGYVVPPHRNKFGKDYPAVTVDQYPGPGRRQ